MRTWIAIAIIMVAGCAPAKSPSTITDPGSCEDACNRLQAMGCVAGQPTPKGTPCVQVCLDTERTGYTTMHPACVADARTCDEADLVSAEGCGR